MGVDYRFYNRMSLGKIEWGQKYYFVEGYHIHNSEYLCRVMGLPEIPYYYCSEEDGYLPLNKNFYFQRFYLPNYYRNLYLEKNTCKWTGREKKRYKAYLHWKEWGLKKLETITLEDIKNLTHIDPVGKEVLINTLDELKKDIPNFLECYKNHRYLFTCV